jgi:HD-GYP domain-containing protein (c-di-GMP phosphodiesterase class II)
MIIAKWLRLPERDVKRVTQAGFLHDIGKSRVPLEILDKTTPLSEKEFEIIKQHPLYGYQILEESGFEDNDIKNAVLMHHKRITSKGYPNNLPESLIGNFASIVSIADVYDAMTSDRVYKKKANPFAVFEMFLKEGRSDFDTFVVNEFVNRMSLYLIGSKVKLSNGAKGEIVYIPPQDVLSPVVLSNGNFLSIGKDGLTIIEML